MHKKPVERSHKILRRISQLSPPTATEEDEYTFTDVSFKIRRSMLFVSLPMHSSAVLAEIMRILYSAYYKYRTHYGSLMVSTMRLQPILMCYIRALVDRITWISHLLRRSFLQSCLVVLLRALSVSSPWLFLFRALWSVMWLISSLKIEIEHLKRLTRTTWVRRAGINQKTSKELAVIMLGRFTPALSVSSPWLFFVPGIVVRYVVDKQSEGRDRAFVVVLLRESRLFESCIKDLPGLPGRYQGPSRPCQSKDFQGAAVVEYYDHKSGAKSERVSQVS